MITSSYGTTATERSLPKLALDFTTASLDPRVTFTRTTNSTNPATYVNSSGNVTAATNNQPRFDYNPITLACNGLLIEEQRTNLITYSEQFNDSSWAKSFVTISTDSAVSPDGTQNADAIVEDTTTNAHQITKSISGFSSGNTYSASCFFKNAGRRYIRFFFAASGAFSAEQGALFDTQLGVITSLLGSATATITQFANGWYRCTITATATATATAILGLRLFNGTSSTYTGDGVSGIASWGVQVEAGAFPTSYIPTTTTALTRNADVATMTGTNFSSWYNATNGASDIWLIPKSTSTLAYMSFDDNTANNKIIIANSTTSGQSTITSGGILQTTLTAGTITANTTNKVGCSWNTDNCAATANAATPATTASATIPTVTQLRIGSNGSLYANAWIQKLFYWPQRMTNNEIQAFTK